MTVTQVHLTMFQGFSGIILLRLSPQMHYVIRDLDNEEQYMPTALWCILAAAILPVLSVVPAKLSREFDNARPRDPDYWKDGFRARAQAAQANGFEAFPFFAVSVFVAMSQGASQYWIDQLAVLFVLLRVIYIFCYWTDRSNPRSLAWTASFITIVALFTSSLWS
ncbi:MAPEG family protein [uncultured Roseibium sp.]|uniref:MAPEG family protein n=1 Tax=uncultured Roseibium sp. TaxID=1936171 RepID=UPI002615033D|nr:MAPEG family protein [uncultured Roseibium sp.]